MNIKMTRPLTAAFLGTALVFSAGAFANDPPQQRDSLESEQPGTDTWITTKVKADLLVTDGVEGTKINVSTTNGVVTLAGVLDDESQVSKAIEVARGIEGVVSVDSRALTSR